MTEHEGAAVEASWARVDREIAEIEAARPGEYDDPTRRNLAALLDFIRSSGRPAPDVEPGYWPTFNVSWTELPETRNLVIEVFDDRYETYRFYDGRSDIRHHDYVGEGVLPPGVIDELPSALADLKRENV